MTCQVTSCWDVLCFCNVGVVVSGVACKYCADYVQQIFLLSTMQQKCWTTVQAMLQSSNLPGGSWLVVTHA